MKKIIIFVVLLIIISSLSIVNAGLFGNDANECDYFTISIPEGYSQAGELNNEGKRIFISMGDIGKPYHGITIEEVDTFTNFEDEKITVESNKTEGNIIFYKTHQEGIYENCTYAFYTLNGFNYELQIWHDHVIYDDNQFNEDVNILKNIAISIERK